MKTENKKQNNMDDTLSEKILSRIESENINPDPKWQFILKEDIFWLLWTISVIVGAGAVAVIIYRFQNSGFRYYEVTHDGLLSFAFDALPIIWLSALVLIVALCYINIRHTKKGYRYPLWLVLSASIGVSVVVGNILFASGIGSVIDKELSERVPFGPSVFMFQKDKWVKPENGLLAGNVVEFLPESKKLVIEDFSGKSWNVVISEMMPKDFMILSNEEQVRIVGIPATTTDSFYGCFVFPWGIPNDMGRKMLPPRDGNRERMTFPDDESIFDSTRINNCEGVRPYKKLQRLRELTN